MAVVPSLYFRYGYPGRNGAVTPDRPAFRGA
jgi:hypothetical protein